MKALRFHEHGEIDVLRLEDVEDPTPSDGEVLLRVDAVALNHADLFARRGMPDVRVPLPMTTGIDIAGTIVGTTPRAVEAGWSEGDRAVIYPITQRGLIGETMPGGLCQLFVTDVAQLTRIPDELSSVNAAALPVAYGTAHRMMVTRGAVKSSERVVVLGASGGVGIACVQYAKAVGAEVVACVGSVEKGKKMLDHGADYYVDYSTEDLVGAIEEIFGRPRLFDKKSGELALLVDEPSTLPGADVIVNFTAGETWVPSLKCLRFQGRMLTCGATAGYDPATDVRFIFSRELSIIGSTGWTPTDQDRIVDLAASGAVPPIIDSVFPLEAYQEAFARLEERRVVGKVVITP